MCGEPVSRRTTQPFFFCPESQDHNFLRTIADSYFFFLSFFHPELGRAAWGRPPPLLFPLSILGESNNTYNAVVQYGVAAARSLLIMRFYYLLIS